MENHELWREHLTVYISRPAKDFISGALNLESEKAMQLFRERVSACFESEYLLLKSAFSFPIHRLTAVELFAEFFGAVNKSLAAEEIDYGKIFSPDFSDVYRNEFSGQDHAEHDRERRPLPNGITGCTVTGCITTFWSCGSFRAST